MVSETHIETSAIWASNKIVNILRSVVITAVVAFIRVYRRVERRVVRAADRTCPPAAFRRRGRLRLGHAVRQRDGLAGYFILRIDNPGLDRRTSFAYVYPAGIRVRVRRWLGAVSSVIYRPVVVRIR